jgi:hypothetical protein
MTINPVVKALSKALVAERCDYISALSGEAWRVTYSHSGVCDQYLPIHNPLRVTLKGLGYEHGIASSPQRSDAIKQIEEHLAVDRVVIVGDMGCSLRKQSLKVLVPGDCLDIEGWYQRTNGMMELGLSGYYWCWIGEQRRVPTNKVLVDIACRRALKLMNRFGADRKLSHMCLENGRMVSSFGVSAYTALLDIVLANEASKSQRKHLDKWIHTCLPNLIEGWMMSTSVLKRAEDVPRNLVAASNRVARSFVKLRTWEPGRSNTDKCLRRGFRQAVSGVHSFAEHLAQHIDLMKS